MFEAPDAAGMETMTGSSFGKRLVTKLKASIGYVAAFLLIVVVLAWQGDVFKPKMDPGAVEDARAVASEADTVRVRREALPVSRRVVGSVMPREMVELASQASGEVLEVTMETGDRVEAGQVLLRVDPELPEARVAEAEAALELARADFSGSERLLSHVAAAAEANALPRTEAIDARRMRDRAARAVDQRRAALDAAETQRGYSVLRSPISGVVVDRLQDVGDLVMPGRPVALLYEPSRLEVVAAVPASLAARCPPGTELRCHIEALGVEVTGVVRTRQPRVDPASRTVWVKMSMDPPEGVLPGMYVRVLLEDRAVEAPVVPAKAVGRLRGLSYARVVDEHGRVDHRLVRPGRTVGDRMEILSGLEAGDRVLRDYAWSPGAGDAE